MAASNFPADGCTPLLFFKPVSLLESGNGKNLTDREGKPFRRRETNKATLCSNEWRTNNKEEADGREKRGMREGKSDYI